MNFFLNGNKLTTTQIFCCFLMRLHFPSFIASVSIYINSVHILKADTISDFKRTMKVNTDEYVEIRPR